MNHLVLRTFDLYSANTLFSFSLNMSEAIYALRFSDFNIVPSTLIYKPSCFKQS
jgi:hypothetical protein